MNTFFDQDYQRRRLEITYRYEDYQNKQMSDEEFKAQKQKTNFDQGIKIYAFVVCILLIVLLAMILLRMKRKREEKKFKMAQSIMISSNTM